MGPSPVGTLASGREALCGVVMFVLTPCPHTALVVAEMMRRFVWNFFRVELAHVQSQEED